MTPGGFLFLLIVIGAFSLIGYSIGFGRGKKGKKQFPWSKVSAVFVALTLGFGIASAFAFTMSWSPVTEYTDNTAIGPEAQGVFYNVEMDGVVVATKLTATSWILPPIPKKSTHQFRAQTELGALDNTGLPIRSEWSPFYTWTSPAGNPKAPGQMRVSP